ncbi:hypothetical protein [Nocardiopsis lambiniae]|uniref:Uncharacterized protein n=1 Tax=Nocardiopsis lambiniae TaxID=3075539 RepID=A0ABU2M5R2_9ACTN|nr:hypothetical protein [Nocardiopsis sp. DSM 44743]MDT0327927.1 hypothetical protein [Nocardiopsis sp. DSM 44743]
MGVIGTWRRPTTWAMALSTVLTAFVAPAPSPAVAAPTPAGPGLAELPVSVHGGAWRSGHVQGIALDRERGHVYFSFTDTLVKTDLAGEVIGTVTGLTGHLGDLDVDARDGRIYGSLEYRAAEAFYIAIFDPDRITRVGMDAETDGVLTTVHLAEVVADYTADMDGDGVFDGNVAATADHRYGCSGIDGIAFGPEFGRSGGRTMLTVAYGIYANADREDNDHQVLLQYDVSRWRRLGRPLDQDAPHTSGPRRPAGKYFVYTGNTTHGVRNLEYDAATGDWFMAVYTGVKPHFPNHSLYVVDGSRRPVLGPIRGQAEEERGWLLSLREGGVLHDPTGVAGWPVSGGQYGLASLGDGRFYVVERGRRQENGVLLETGVARLHRWTGAVPDPFAPVEG